MIACVPDALRFIHVIEDLLRGGHPVRFRAPGWSMHPTIRNGDAITVAPLGHAPVRVGEVVLYRRGSGAIAHRVIRVQSANGRSVGLVLRGDGAHSCDRPIHLAQVLGRVLSVERDGRRMDLDPMGPAWSRAIGLALRVARHVRTRSQSVSLTGCHIK
jgi:hypothetical protein